MKMPRDEYVPGFGLNPATFQYFDGFGCRHFCLKPDWIGIDDILLNIEHCF